jgi:hypothetical protein
MKAKMKATFNTALNNIFKDKKNLENTTILTLPAWKLLYKNSDVQLSQF